MNLIVDKKLSAKSHVSLDAIKEFEKVIGSDSKTNLSYRKNKFLTYLLYKFYKFNIKFRLESYTYIVRIFRVYFPKRQQYFAVLMGLDIKKCILQFFSPFNYKSIYLFDAWTNVHNEIIEFVNFFKINNVFVTSSMALELLNAKLPKSIVHWIPEGINTDEYIYYSFEDKNIDVLSLGRKYDDYHEMIVNYLPDKNRVYLYEKVRGEIIFPTRGEFIEGLGRSKISICIPSSITHPDRAGGIETMTIRYLQSMASKCIIVGHAPMEMIQLFGYNPVIEIDWTNPQEQLLDILNDYNKYIPMIEKNYEVVCHSHTWECRWTQIKGILNEKTMIK